MSTSKRRVLLISNSTQHGTGYLEHCAGEVADFLAGVECVTFVPWALHDLDAYAAAARGAFAKHGKELVSVHEVADPALHVATAAQAVFTGGGNTFRLVKRLHETGVLDAIRLRALAGMPYMGTSAGSNIACPTLKTTNDMPIVEPPSFAALALVPFQLNPHYLDPSPDSTHMGETRETRIREFHEENDVPVLGLREGGMLRIEGDSMTLRGASLRLFRRDQDPEEFAPGADLSFALM